MPTWTSNVTNVPDIQRKKQSFDDALNSINQFAGIMHQFQQAKQAENINKLTLGLKFADMYEGDAKHNALKELDQVIFDVTKKRVNWDALKPVDMDTATKSMMNIINNKKLSPVEQAGAMETFLRNFKPDVAKRLTEAVNQQQLKENVATLQGQPTTTVLPFQTALPQGTPGVRPQFAGEGERTTPSTPQSQTDALNALRLSEEGRKVMGTLIPKEKTPSVQKLFNKDTGQSVSLDLTNPDQYKIFFELQGKGWEADRRPQPKETLTDFSVFYKAGKLADKTDAQISKEWENRKIEIAKLSRPPQKTEKEFKESDYRAYRSQARRYAMDLMGKGNTITTILSSGGSLDNALSQAEQGLTPQQKAAYKEHVKEFFELNASDKIVQEFERREGRIKQSKTQDLSPLPKGLTEGMINVYAGQLSRDEVIRRYKLKKGIK